jgi:hypothetical protein
VSKKRIINDENKVPASAEYDDQALRKFIVAKDQLLRCWQEYLDSGPLEGSSQDNIDERINIVLRQVEELNSLMGKIIGACIPSCSVLLCSSHLQGWRRRSYRLHQWLQLPILHRSMS